MSDDLSIPAFLRATGPGTPCQVTGQAAVVIERQRPYPLTDADRRAIEELTNKQLQRDAVKQYEEEKRFAAFQQWCHDNPELAAMNAKAKRDARRRIAKLGVKATGRRGRR